MSPRTSCCDFRWCTELLTRKQCLGLGSNISIFAMIGLLASRKLPIALINAKRRPASRYSTHQSLSQELLHSYGTSLRPITLHGCLATEDIPTTEVDPCCGIRNWLEQLQNQIACRGNHAISKLRQSIKARRATVGQDSVRRLEFFRTSEICHMCVPHGLRSTNWVRS